MPLNMVTIFLIDQLLVGSITCQKTVKYVDPTAKDDVPEGPQPKDIQLPVREVKKPEFKEL